MTRGRVTSRDVSRAAAAARDTGRDVPLSGTDWAVRAERLRVFRNNAHANATRQHCRWYYRLVHVRTGYQLGGQDTVSGLVALVRLHVAAVSGVTP